MTGMKSRMAPFFPAIWDDGDDGDEGNVLGMTETVIPTSFLSSQIAGKYGAILDFIPVIPDYSRHSGVIPKFSTNVNFLE